MAYKYYLVIEQDGYYKTLVLALMEPDAEGVIHENIQGYKLLDGESLVLRTDECRQPTFRPHAGVSGFVYPRWDGSAWAEGATAEEITAWETEHPAPAVPGPSAQEDADSLLIDHEYRLTLLELGVI